MQWDRKKEGRPALHAESGTLLVRGCEFQEDKPQIELGEAIRRAVIAENIFTGRARITNHSKGQIIINGNAGDVK